MSPYTTELEWCTWTMNTIVSADISSTAASPSHIVEENGPNKLDETKAATILWAAINFVLFICILGGNTLTIIAVRTCRRLRSVISNLFILSLAISDFMVGLALPYHVAFYLGWDLEHSHFLCLFRFFLMIFACCVSLGTLISIAIDRYIAIIYALHYRRYMTRRVAYLIISLNWLTGATVASIPMFWNHWNTAVHCEVDEILPPGYVVGIITPAFVLIWTLMLILYWRIMREAARQARQLASYGNSDWKSIQIVVLIMGCFTFCWLPYFVVICTKTFKTYNDTTLLYKYALTLATSNSGLNPVIYAWKNSNYRKAFVRILCCRSPNCHIQKSEVSQFHSVAKPVRSSIPMQITPCTNTVPQIIIVPVCDTTTEISDCANNTTQNIAANQCVTNFCDQNLCPTTTYTCPICKSVLRRSLKLQHELDIKAKTCKLNV